VWPGRSRTGRPGSCVLQGGSRASWSGQCGWSKRGEEHDRAGMRAGQVPGGLSARRPDGGGLCAGGGLHRPDQYASVPPRTAVGQRLADARLADRRTPRGGDGPQGAGDHRRRRGRGLSVPAQRAGGPTRRAGVGALLPRRHAGHLLQRLVGHQERHLRAGRNRAGRAHPRRTEPADRPAPGHPSAPGPTRACTGPPWSRCSP
jgi:hypothetical protein